MTVERFWRLKEYVRWYFADRGIFIHRGRPRGYDPIGDIARIISRSGTTVIDVGANEGQTTFELLNRLPGATVHSFEPDPDTFRQLQRTILGSRNCLANQVALGSVCERRLLCRTAISQMRYLALQEQVASTDLTLPDSIYVDVVTLDEYCSQRSIEGISFLKIDTEGNDLEVLKGALSLIREGRILFIQVEAALNFGDSGHVQISEFNDLLFAYGFRVFGIYHQTPYSNPPQQIMWCDVIYSRTEHS